MKPKIIIIGGGASGIICALRLKIKNPEFEVLILEQNPRVGKKILKTGNGRCNISNLNLSGKNYNHPEFINHCLEKFSVEDLIAFFRELGLIIRPDASNRLYPYSDYANTVLDVLLYALKKYNVKVMCDEEVRKIKSGDGFEIITANNRYNADMVVVATGSIAQEKTNGYDLLKSLGHSVTALEPGLVALKTKEYVNSLRGIRIKCKAMVIDRGQLLHEEEGEILFKEQGLSGILSMNLSRYVKTGSIVSLDLFPEIDPLPFMTEALNSKNMEDVLMGMLPKMLVQEILKRSKNYNLNEVYANLRSLSFEITGRYGFDMAQITIGGVPIQEINSDFSSKKTKGLYIIGEVLDVDGECGGYNLHFAWMSGILAADAIASHFEKKL